MTTTYFWPTLTLVLALGLYAQGQQLNQSQAHATGLEHQLELASVQKKNLETQYRHDTAQKDKETKTAIEVAHADAARARNVAIGLRHDLASFLEADRHRAQTAAAAGQCTPNDTTAMVLADLLSQADDAAGELAAAFDEAHARGLGCEASYGTVAGSN